MKVLVQLLVLMFLAACSQTPAFAAPPIPVIRDLSSDRGPMGWQEFCKREPLECLPYGDSGKPIKLTEENIRLMMEINAAVNKEMAYKTDFDHYKVDEHWGYLDADGFGDCDNYVMEKKKRLIAAGFPASQIQISLGLVRSVWTGPEKGAPDGSKFNLNGHVILAIQMVNDKGPYEVFMDMERDELYLLNDIDNFAFLVRQSAIDPRVWLHYTQ